MADEDFTICSGKVFYLYYYVERRICRNKLKPLVALVKVNRRLYSGRKSSDVDVREGYTGSPYYKCSTKCYSRSLEDLNIVKKQRRNQFGFDRPFVG